MPAASASKRVKNTRISRPFIIGNEAWSITPGKEGVPESHTKGWKVYVRACPGGPDITTWLKKVQFKLHHTYADASRTVEGPPFEVQETGYGEFEIELRLYFDSSSGEKAQYRFHRLRLEAFGDEAQVAQQTRDKKVVADTCEIVEFNEPSWDFFAKMTSDDQFAAYKAGTKGKGRGKTVAWEGGREPSANFPDKGTPEAPWSKEMEKKMLEMLGDAQRELDVEVERERERAKERQRRLQDVST